MDNKKLVINKDEAHNILEAIDFIQKEGFTGDGLDEIQTKLKNWINSCTE